MANVRRKVEFRGRGKKRGEGRNGALVWNGGHSEKGDEFLPNYMCRTREKKKRGGGIFNCSSRESVRECFPCRRRQGRKRRVSSYDRRKFPERLLSTEKKGKEEEGELSPVKRIW